MEDQKPLISRLIVFFLLGFVIFASIYAAQKVSSLPKSQIKKSSTQITLTPTPSIEIFETEEDSTISATISGDLIFTP